MLKKGELSKRYTTDCKWPKEMKNMSVGVLLLTYLLKRNAKGTNATHQSISPPK